MERSGEHTVLSVTLTGGILHSKTYGQTEFEKGRTKGTYLHSITRITTPYDKWLVEAAKQTQLGAMVYPSIQRAVGGIGDFLDPLADRHWRDWVPVKELRATLPIVQNGLKELGWVCDWIDNPEAAYFDETVRRPAP